MPCRAKSVICFYTRGYSAYSCQFIITMEPKPGDTIVVWFSCGAPSAVAAKLTLEKYGNTCVIRIVNNPIADEDPDNIRFLTDIEIWLNHPIEFAINSKYPNHSCEEVWNERKYMSGTKGAPCTKALKREARYEFENHNRIDWHVFGYAAEEIARYEAFKFSERANTLGILIDAGLTRQDCYNLLLADGIRPPIVYEMGLPNANCPGCVKATSPTYWNLIRVTHPDVFKRRAEQSRRIGCRLVRYKGKRIFLDELPPDAKGRPIKNMKIDCGIFCDIHPKLLKQFENKYPTTNK